MAKVLIVDDDRLNSEMLFDMISSMGYEVSCAYTAAEGLQKVYALAPDVVFLDVRLPDGDGLMLLPTIHTAPSMPEVIIITGYGSPDGAEMAIKNGAWDFIEKPLIWKLIELPLTRALQYRAAKAGKRVPLVLRREGIIGSSPTMETCLEQIAQAAASEANVLITGETGTGKELFAQAVYANSARSGKNFVTVDCASLPPTIIESILFGHEKGAFTGAERPQEGLIKQANGGILFLDEVGELPLAAQKSFLRVLQEHRFRPLGAKQEIKSDFRIIAATNRDLDKMVQEGTFREDLLFRLRGYAITLPPLREHPKDIDELSLYYIHKLCKHHGIELKGFATDFIEALNTYPWPGNIRELFNALDRSLMEALHEPILYAKHLPTDIRIRLARESVRKKTDVHEPIGYMGTLKEHREAVLAREEQQYLRELMTTTGWDIKKACATSGLSRVRLYVLLSRYNIRRPLAGGVS